MFLKKLSLVNFKNYNELEIELSPKINCVIGNNGVGKTNLLDAIYYLSFCKSYFNSVDSQNINHDSPFFVIQGDYSINDQTEKIYCGVKRNQKKQFKKGNKTLDKLADHIGYIPLVMISPYDSSFILGGSDERRKLMNIVISQYNKNYLNQLITYNKALQQRNILLKEFSQKGNFNEEMLDLWDQQLIEPAITIFEERKHFIELIIPIFQKYYELISSAKEKVSLELNSQLIDTEFNQLLKNNWSRDRFLQYTSVGIHKDDLTLMLGNHLLKKLGSQGQQKTFLIALKLAQFDYMNSIYGFKPLLLLDDIFDRLDAERVKNIVQLVADNNFGQIFITDTSTTRLKSILEKTSVDFKLFSIKENNLKTVSI